MLDLEVVEGFEGTPREIAARVWGEWREDDGAFYSEHVGEEAGAMVRINARLDTSLCPTKVGLLTTLYKR
jgi:hypothetical protein